MAAFTISFTNQLRNRKLFYYKLLNY